MRIVLAGAACAMLTAPALANTPATDPPLFTLDERTWILFYDLPSRRFRTIRDAFIRRDFDAASRDLAISAGFVAAETARTDPALEAPLADAVARLNGLAGSIATPEGAAGAKTGDLDAAFSRTHWLLAQHYLILAERARDDGRHRAAGNYLTATAHHMERSVLWSNARITSTLVKDIDRLRTMGDELSQSTGSGRAYRDRPVRNARKTLLELGRHLDRRVWVAPAAVTP